jgi:uncharacterized repeat protein (TIGR03803 family)
MLPVSGAQAAVVLTALYSFGSVQDTNGVPLDGGSPVAGLVQGSDGYFYGTTEYGGTTNYNADYWVDGYGYGTVFKISTNGVLTSLHSFTGGNDGAYPYAGLAQGSDGNFYGTTSHSSYSVFSISTNGALTTWYSHFFPNNGLVQGSDGNFYGTTPAVCSFFGCVSFGTVFRLTIVPEPQLTIIPSGLYVIVTWPTDYAGFTLQSTTNLGSAAVWSTNSAPPVVIGGENVVINTMSSRQQFYRLSQ